MSWANMVVTPKKYKDIRTPFPNLKVALGLEIFYKPKNTLFSLLVKRSNIGYGFKLRNNHISDTSRGYITASETGSIEQYQINISAIKESQKFKPFVGKTTIKFNLKAGVGIGFNRSQMYYDSSFYKEGLAIYNDWSFIKYETTISKKYIGYYISTSAGMMIYNKKKKKILSVDAYYDFGLRKMAAFSTNFHYGRGRFVNQNFYIDAANSTKQDNFITFTRGSTFGVSLGIPITIKK
jgi:hypothetical protein